MPAAHTLAVVRVRWARCAITRNVFRDTFGECAELTSAFVAATIVPPMQQLEMQARLQCYFDNAMSKNDHVPATYEVDDFRAISIEPSATTSRAARTCAESGHCVDTDPG